MVPTFFGDWFAEKEGGLLLEHTLKQTAFVRGIFH
jgi:hypothetical protein